MRGTKTPPYAIAAITAITLAGLLLRLHTLGGPSLWYDEGATLKFALAGPDRWITDTHPPLYYALVHYWLRFGHSEFWIRMLSVIPAVATLPVIFSLGKKMFGTNAGLLSASFMALLAFHIDHSQQARMYTFLVFFFACALWAMLTASREGRQWHWVIYTISATLLAYSQGIGLVYVAVLALLFPLISPAPRPVAAWTRFLLANSAVGLLYLPWLNVLRLAHFRVGFLSWVPRPEWWSIPGTLFAFVCRYIPVDSIPHLKHGVLLEKVLVVAILVAPTLALSFIALRRAFSTRQRMQRWAATTAVAMLMLPLVLVYALSLFVTPMYLDRALLPAAVGLVLILGASICELAESPRLLGFLIVAGLTVSCLNTYYFFKYKDREDYRSLSQELQRDSGPEEMILFVADSGLPQFLIEFYDPEKHLAAARKLDIQTILRGCHGTLDECLDGYSGEFRKSRRVWIVYAHEHSVVNSSSVQNWLDKHFTQVSYKTFKLPIRLSETRASGF